MHLHNGVHGNPALTHEHLVHPDSDLQTHFMFKTSLHSFVVAVNVIHIGFQIRQSSFCQPKFLGQGNALKCTCHPDTSLTDRPLNELM